MVGIGHLGPHGEGTRLGIDLRIGEIDQSPIGILRPVGQRDRNIGSHLRSNPYGQIDVTGLATQVIQRGHTEIDPHRIALYHEKISHIRFPIARNKNTAALYKPEDISGLPFGFGLLFFTGILLLLFFPAF